MHPRPPTDEHARPVVLLGAQRFKETLGHEVRELAVGGPIALVTAGWQEREAEDEPLRTHLMCETVNLRLYQRAEQVFSVDKELAQAHRQKQTKLRHKQDFYRIRLEHELDANHVIRQRKAPPDVLEEEEGASVDAIRQLDAAHLAQVGRVHDVFDSQHRPLERSSVREHTDELRKILARCTAVAIAGGHVASMLSRMRLFGLRDLIKEHTIFAWSAGAMAITECVVLFHDDPPQGRGASEVLDHGLGLVRPIVAFPHPETRLRMQDTERVSLLARRFAPAVCLAFLDGAHVIVRGRRFARPSSVLRLSADGSCVALEETPS